MFRSAHVPAEWLYPRHRHAWGEFVYSFSGVMELTVSDRQLLAPPQYGVWLPRDVEHVAVNRLAAHFRNPEQRLRYVNFLRIAAGMEAMSAAQALR